MATLTEVSEMARKAVIFVICGIIFVAILLIISPIIIARLKKPVVPPAPKAEAAFGKLPPIAFPQNRTYPLSFKLENIEGRPPESSPTAKIYFIPKKSAGLFSRKNAISFAALLGFTSEPENLNDIIYKFNDEKRNRTLTMDITDNNFHLAKNSYDAAFFQKAAFLDENGFIELARNFFSSLNVFDQTLNRTKITYYSFDGQKLITAKKPAEAQAVRVDFLQSSIAGIPLITANLDASNCFVIFSPKTTSGNTIDFLVEASWQNFPPDLVNPSTYLTISSAAAWENLKNGKGFIVRPLSSGTEAVIRTIYEAYYQSDEYQPFLQPVFVFVGDQDFVGIVTAIDPFWIGS